MQERWQVGDRRVPQDAAERGDGCRHLLHPLAPCVHDIGRAVDRPHERARVHLRGGIEPELHGRDDDSRSATAPQRPEEIANGTLFRFAASKAELLITVQNEKFGAAVDEGLTASSSLEGTDASLVETVMALLLPVIGCVREQPENGRIYLHELLFGDPAEEHRAAGLAEAQRLEASVTDLLRTLPNADRELRETLARVVTSIIHVAMTATVHLRDSHPAITDLGCKARVTQGNTTASVRSVSTRRNSRESSASAPLRAEPDTG